MPWPYPVQNVSAIGNSSVRFFTAAATFTISGSVLSARRIISLLSLWPPWMVRIGGIRFQQTVLAVKEIRVFFQPPFVLGFGEEFLPGLD